MLQFYKIMPRKNIDIIGLKWINNINIYSLPKVKNYIISLIMLKIN